jgi:BirA family biotin operon repressor/biotin-[acetyl-CoA-carboxylase] ligase
MADTQTAGMGRKGRAWASSSSKGLWMSVLLKRPLEARRVFLIPFWFSMALASTLESLGVQGVSPVWPNDLYLKGCKMAGILLDTSVQGERLETAVIGVGLNLNQTVEEFPDDIKDTAISMRMATGKEWSQKEILRRFLWRLPEVWSYLEKEGDTAFLKAYWKLSMEATSGFVFWSSGRRAHAAGLDPSGGLCLKMDDGSVCVVQDIQDIVKIKAGK